MAALRFGAGPGNLHVEGPDDGRVHRLVRRLVGHIEVVAVGFDIDIDVALVKASGSLEFKFVIVGWKAIQFRAIARGRKGVAIFGAVVFSLLASPSFAKKCPELLSGLLPDVVAPDEMVIFPVTDLNGYVRDDSGQYWTPFATDKRFVGKEYDTEVVSVGIVLPTSQ